MTLGHMEMLNLIMSSDHVLFTVIDLLDLLPRGSPPVTVYWSRL